MEITRSEVVAYVRSLPVSRQLQGRFIVYILDKFPTVTQFLVSSEKELGRLSNYGRKMKKVVDTVKDEFWRRQHDAKDQVLFDKRVQETVEKLNAEYEKMNAALNPRLTLAELQGIVSMMQLMNLDEIDLRTIRKFLDSVRVKTDDKATS